MTTYGPYRRPEMDEEAVKEHLLHTPFSQVKEEGVYWLWPGRIALGAITLLDGDPGLGKSLLTLDLAARVSTGREMPDGAPGMILREVMPDGEVELWGGGPEPVLLLSAEDDPARTILPRLVAAKAALELVELLSDVKSRNLNTGRTATHPFRVPHDIPYLEDTIEAVGASLVVIDPLMAFLEGGVNSWRDQDVRAALAPLAEVARNTWTAIVILRHLNKAAGASAIYRGGGSIGFIGAARSGLLVAKYPDDPEHERVLASTKSNLGPPMPSLRYRIMANPSVNGVPGIPWVEWKGECELSATQLLNAAQTDRGESHPGRMQAAVEWLRATLAEGPRLGRDVEREAQAAGIAEGTLRRAREQLEITYERRGYGAAMQTWWIAGSETEETETEKPAE